MNLLLSEIPFRIIAVEIEGSQAWGYSRRVKPMPVSLLCLAQPLA